MPEQIPTLSAVSDVVCAVAKEELLPRFADVQRRFKSDGSVVTDVDHAMQNRLQAELARRWPGFDFLGEEMTTDSQQQALAARDGCWCLDPLDGTTNYAAGIPFFAVSLALLRDGQPVLGIVYDPVRGECFAAERGRGARLNGVPLGAGDGTVPPLSRCVAVVDFKRLTPALAAELGAKPPYGSQRNFGACSLEWCWLAARRFHLYLHGGQKLWDYAAGHLILSEAGMPSATLAGEGVFAPTLVPRSAVASVDPSLHLAWKGWLGGVRT